MEFELVRQLFGITKPEIITIMVVTQSLATSVKRQTQLTDTILTNLK